MRINDIGKHFMSAEFSKLAKTTKQVRESKLLEGTPGCSDCEYIEDETDGMITTCDECAAEMNEAPTDQYSASNSRRLLVQLDNMQSAMEKIVNELYGSDNGDLQDQITTMDKYLKGFNAVIARAMKVVPNESIEEGRMSMRQLASMDKDKARKIEAMVGPESKYDDMGDYQEALYRAAMKMGLIRENNEDDFRDGHDLELLKQVSAQIAQDVANNDYTAIDDLLKNVSEAEMKGFLSEMESTVNEKGKGLWHNIHQKRKRGEKPAKPGEKGYPKTLDIKEDAGVKAQYDELTDENQHGEAALLLAKTYGTELEAKLIQAIMDVHHARGNIMPEEQKLRDSIANKYYKQMMSDTFPANTSATQGKRMGVGEDKATKDAWIKKYPDDVNIGGTGGPGATRRINMMKKNDLYDKDHGVKKRTVKTAGGKGPSSGPADPKVNTGPIKPIKRPNVPKSSWAQVLDFDVKKNKKKKESIGEDYTNMFGIQVRDIDDKIRDTEVQIDLAGRNQGGWKQSDIPKLESKLAHLKMKKSKGITEEAEKKPYICVHATKGKHECHAMSSYGAAKIAAEKWGLKSTSGIDCHLAVEEGVPGMAMPGMEPEKKICCKHCGDELYGKPETDCPYDINNPNQDNWILVDIDGDGDPDMKIAMGSMPEGWMDDAKDAAGSTLGKITNKVAGDFAKRKKLFGKSKAN